MYNIHKFFIKLDFLFTPRFSTSKIFRVLFNRKKKNYKKPKINQKYSNSLRIRLKK